MIEISLSDAGSPGKGVAGGILCPVRMYECATSRVKGHVPCSSSSAKGRSVKKCWELHVEDCWSLRLTRDKILEIEVEKLMSGDCIGKFYDSNHFGRYLFIYVPNGWQMDCHTFALKTHQNTRDGKKPVQWCNVFLNRVKASIIALTPWRLQDVWYCILRQWI